MMGDIVARLREQREMGFRGPVVDTMDAAADEIERLRYVLGGVRNAIKTGRNEPLVIWKEQIDIALGEGE